MSKAQKILVVDHDPALREQLHQDLSGKDYTVVSVPSGEDALWELGHSKFHLVLTGMALRGISGLDMAEEIRVRQMGLPVVILAGHGAPFDQEQATAAGVAEFLHQPCSSEQLADVVERLLKAAESAAITQAPSSAAKTRPAKTTNPFVLRLKNIGLFLLGPFISLFYLLTFPVIGLGMLVYMAFMAREQKSAKAESPPPAAQARSSVLKSMGIMVVMTLGGIVYGIFVPILGIGLVLWFGLQAWGKLGARAVGSGQT